MSPARLLTILGPLLACSPSAKDTTDTHPHSSPSDGTDGTDGADSSGTDSAEPGAEPLPGSCGAESRWNGTAPAFAEATEAWGLADVGVRGIRPNAVDFDGDGWTDLVVRTGSGGNDFDADTRTIWLLRNTGTGTFEDVTQTAGGTLLRDGSAGRRAHVWVWGDVDNDGDLDAWTGVTSTDLIAENELLLNNGDGTFSYADGPVDAREHPANQYGAAFVDTDRDGNLDLWITSYSDTEGQPAQDRLYRGDGTGGFVEVTSEAGLTTLPWTSVGALNGARSHTRSWSALACDLNNDGFPELMSSSYGRSPNHLWTNNGDGTFQNSSIASGYAFDHRSDWSDNESARCYCQLNPGAADCDGIPAPELIACSEGTSLRWDHTYDREAFRLGGNSGQTVCQDVDNDGWFDLLTTEIVHWDVGASSDPSEVLFNTGTDTVTFDRPGRDPTGLARDYDRVDWNEGDITGTVFDFDNDCWHDLYVGSSDYPGTRGLLYHADAWRHYEPVAIDLGVDHFRSHGAAVADFDRDGDLDLVVGHSRSRCDGDCYETAQIRLFENTWGQDHRFVQLQLVGGPGSNRAAIGARVDVTAGGVTQARQVQGGGGQWGHQDDLLVHVGVGAETTAEVTVTWPDAARTQQTFSIDTGARYRVVQGDAPIEVAAPGGG